MNTKIIIEFMQQHKQTKTEFCNACGISLYILNKILNNVYPLKITPFIKMALYMNVKLKDLINF